MRINVTGNAGAGKSTLSCKISDALGVPLIEMDRLVWDTGWRRVEPDVWREKLSPMLEGESWVVDGVSRSARYKADLIVFLDYPRHVCAWRCLKRGWRHFLQSRPGLPENCPEWRIAPTLGTIIMNFPYKARPIILQDVSERDSAGIVIKDLVSLREFETQIPELPALIDRIRKKTWASREK